MSLTSIRISCALAVATTYVALFPATALGQAVTNANFTSFSLAEAQRLALERNWDLLAAQSGVDSATAQLMAAREFPNPSMSISSARLAGHDEATTMGNAYWDRGYDSIVSVSQLIEIAGKRRDRQNAARQGIRGAKARLYDAKRTLQQAVTKAYLTLLLAEENVRTLTQSSGYMQREGDIAGVRNKAGDLSDADTKQILINAEQYQLQADSAAATAAQARAQLEVLLGVPRLANSWMPSDTLEKLASVSPEQAAPAAGERPDVLAADADLRSAEANVQLQKALRVPDPTFLLEYERNPMPPGPPPPDTFGVGVTFPLPIWNRNTANIKAAEAAREQSALTLGKARAQAMFDITNAQIAYHEALRRWQRYQTQIGPQAAQVRESVSFAYEKGGSSLVDLLDAQRTDNDVRIATAQALSDTASAAADVQAAQTVLSESALTQR